MVPAWLLTLERRKLLGNIFRVLLVPLSAGGVRIRDDWLGGWLMAFFGSEFRQVMRRLGRAPMFTAITLITLAAGIGANTVVFSVLNGVLLKPLPYPDPERLIGVWLSAPKVGIKELNMSPSCYFIFREQSQSFVDIGLYTGDSLSVPGLAEPEKVQAVDVTDGTLPML